MSDAPMRHGLTGGRERQRRRTRRAIVQAAAEFLARGETPSISEIADAADVAKRTVYTYFATLDHLLADAALEASRHQIEPAFTSADPAARLDAFVRSMARGTAGTEHLGRTLLRLTLEAPNPEPGAERVPRRGYRRIEWIERALEPLQEQLTPQRYERLVSALSIVVGWEPFIVLRDTRGLDTDAIEDVTTWIAGTLLRATLEDPAPDRTGTDQPS